MFTIFRVDTRLPFALAPVALSLLMAISPAYASGAPVIAAEPDAADDARPTHADDTRLADGSRAAEPQSGDESSPEAASVAEDAPAPMEVML
ncbi:MAG: hypothetical protein ACRC7Q_04190, partial [Plesiomonas shigelloides]